MANLIYGDDEIIGYDNSEIFGSDDSDLMSLFEGDYDIFGADGANPAMAQMKQQLAAQLMTRNAALVRNKRPQNQGVAPLPFPRTLIAAGATVDIAIRPQRTFRIAGIKVPSTIAAFFDLTQINIGQNPLFAASGPVPASLFTEVAVDQGVYWATANPGIDIILSVRNNDAAAQTFSGAFMGRVVS